MVRKVLTGRRLKQVREHVWSCRCPGKRLADRGNGPCRGLQLAHSGAARRPRGQAQGAHRQVGGRFTLRWNLGKVLSWESEDSCHADSITLLLLQHWLWGLSRSRETRRR